MSIHLRDGRLDDYLWNSDTVADDIAGRISYEFFDIPSLQEIQDELLKKQQSRFDRKLLIGLLSRHLKWGQKLLLAKRPQAIICHEKKEFCMELRYHWRHFPMHYDDMPHIHETHHTLLYDQKHMQDLDDFFLQPNLSRHWMLYMILQIRIIYSRSRGSLKNMTIYLLMHQISSLRR